jgi:hypothetical protein
MRMNRALNVQHLASIFKQTTGKPFNTGLYATDMLLNAPDGAKQRSFPYHKHP